MAFIQYNETTQIWEKAVDPTNAATAFTNLPIANPTVPLQTANKAYVDAAVGSVSGFVPYVGATANVNIGIYNFVGGGAVISGRVQAGTLRAGSGPDYGGYILALNLNAAVILTNISSYLTPTTVVNQIIRDDNTTETSWGWLTRKPGGAENWELFVRPEVVVTRNMLSVGNATYNAMLNVNSGGNTWTTSGWARGIEVQPSNVIKWNTAASYIWGVGQSGDSLYFMWSAGNAAANPLAYFMILNPGTYVHIPGGGATALIVGDTPATSSWGNYQGSFMVANNGVSQIGVKSAAYGTEGGLHAWDGAVYAGSWTAHPYIMRAGNTNKLILNPGAAVSQFQNGKLIVDEGIAIGGPIGVSNKLRIIGLGSAPSDSGDVYTTGDGILRIG